MLVAAPPSIGDSPAQDEEPSKLTMDSSASDAAAVAVLGSPVFIVNRGAFVYWTYNGVQYSAQTNPILHGERLFLPLILQRNM